MPPEDKRDEDELEEEEHTKVDRRASRQVPAENETAEKENASNGEDRRQGQAAAGIDLQVEEHHQEETIGHATPENFAPSGIPAPPLTRQTSIPAHRSDL